MTITMNPHLTDPSPSPDPSLRFAGGVLSTSLLPARAGVGLKPEHIADILEQKPDIGWFEVHPENYMGAGGPPHWGLQAIRESYPLSLHGVGLSIGASGPLDKDHLKRLKYLLDKYQPESFSEHLAWSTHEGHFLNDLLPLPYTRETLDHVSDHVSEVQDVLNRRMLIENPSTYVTFADNDMSEIEFLSSLAQRTGCGLLLDVNNVYVGATNHHYDAATYIDEFPMQHVGEIHLAGYAEARDDVGDRLLIDAHDRSVAEAVWALFERTLLRAGPRPTLIEWDNDVPVWDVLFHEAQKADRLMKRNQQAASSGTQPEDARHAAA